MTIDRQPILYSFRRCPYAMRARLALKVSETHCELREVVLRDKPAEMLAASPKGTVPVLIVLDNEVIDESLDVMLWALRQRDPNGWLTPESGNLQKMLSLIEDFDAVFKPQLDHYKYPNRFDNANAEEARDKAATYLRGVMAPLRNSPYLFGYQMSLADVALIPFVRQFANTDRQWFDAQSWPEIQRWLSSFLDSQLFQDIMHKYPQWQTGEQGVEFPGWKPSSNRTPDQT
ncbi:MAG: glutathione S-transferase [Pseudomonadota bacterium]